MVQHFPHHTHNDPRLLEALVKNFPLAMIAVNGEEGQPPIIAYAPVIFEKETGENGQIDFHLSKKNAIVPYLEKGAKATISIVGPNCHISPSWYEARFSGDNPDRSKTAPTYDFVSATMQGTVATMDMPHLSKHLGKQVRGKEATAGEKRWDLTEIDPDTFKEWRGLIVGFSMPVEHLDLTMKISHDQKPENRPGIIRGLRLRDSYGDKEMAKIIEADNGTTDSLIAALNAIGPESKKAAMHR